MSRIRRIALPEHALATSYLRDGSYTDCYEAHIARAVTHAEFVAAFYTTWLFKIERVILSLLVDKPSSGAQALELAHSERASFAAWTVEAREPDQLLMCDFQGATRSWFMVEREAGGTRLLFGSVVVARARDRAGAKKLTFGFRALLGFHELYSRALLSAARARLARLARRAPPA